MHPSLPTRNLMIRLLALCLLWGMGLSVYPQDRKEQLQREKSKLEEEIRYTNELLEKTRRSKKASVNEVVLLQNKIRKREQLISAYDRQLKSIERDIMSAGNEIRRLEAELQALKEEYARMIYYAQKNRNAYSRLMFIFSAESFNQAYRRLKYFQQYSEYRRRQAELIRETEGELTRRISLLQGQREEKTVILEEEKDERTKLQRERQDKNQALNTLKQQEKSLLQTLREKEKARQRLNQEIERIIAEEIRKAREAGGSRSKAAPSDVFELTPEELELSASFENNHGKLPWPLERGVISGTFGEHDHPVLKGIKTRSNGVDMMTSGGAVARAVFKGKVSRVMNVPRFNTVVIIRHGEYLSVYSNLIDVSVKMGDMVSTKQPIGRVAPSPDEEKTELHFEIWKGKTVMNPEPWLAR
ncbi:MAG TPA: peptidoglycan DD-metalloendopeptidase family protein [Bacteroidales bacterium]|nr:peptidoglycan DD-metalloendopeptidase family protein [Bacteroidales bacterium]